jgi:Tfp pilus assembly protein PilN
MQQVNLFTDAFKPPKVKLPLEQLILFPSLLLVVLVLSSYFMNAHLESEQDKLSSLQAKNTVMAERLAVLNAKAEKQRQDDTLIASNKRLQQTLNAREAMLSTLDRVVLTESEGFSATLIALARQREPGLWLTGIHLGGNSHQMVLQGVTTKAELVPGYLQKLRQESSLLGRKFSIFELNEHEAQPQWLSFSLKAEPGDEADMLVQPMAQRTIPSTEAGVQ